MELSIQERLKDLRVERGLTLEQLEEQVNLSKSCLLYTSGRAKDPAELLEIACGEPFDPAYYTDYLTEKFSVIYGLN